jgi:hypothetical protein
VIDETLDSGTESSTRNGSRSTSVNSARPGATHSPACTPRSLTMPSNGARTMPSETPFA